MKNMFRGGGIALRGMGAALAKGGRAFGGKETYGEELAEAKSVKSGKTSVKSFVKKEKAEGHKGEEKNLSKQAKEIKSGKKSPEAYAKMEAAEPMKKGGRAKKKK